MSKTAHHIAIVDDNETIRQSFKAVLEFAGYGVSEFASGHDFLKRPNPEDTDCVVLDLEMPQLNGNDVLSRLAKNDNTAPVLVITGTQDQAMLDRAAQNNCTAILKKPIGPNALLEAVRSAVEDSAPGG